MPASKKVDIQLMWTHGVNGTPKPEELLYGQPLVNIRKDNEAIYFRGEASTDLVEFLPKARIEALIQSSLEDYTDTELKNVVHDIFGDTPIAVTSETDGEGNKQIRIGILVSEDEDNKLEIKEGALYVSRLTDCGQF